MVFSRPVWMDICRQMPIIVALFSGLVLAFVLTLVSTVVVPLDSATGVVIKLNFVGIGALLLVAGGMILKCRSME